MKFRFQNLGLINDAKLELADLTIICGENNSGKTYITYAIYGLLKSWRETLFEILFSEINKLDEEKEHLIDLASLFNGKLNQYLNKIGKSYISTLPEVFATTKDSFESTQVHISVNEPKGIPNKAFKKTIKRGGPDGKIVATISKEKDSSTLKILVSEVSINVWELSSFIAEAIAEIVFSPVLPDVFIVSAERTGAATFRSELDFARTRMVDALSNKDFKEIQRNPWLLRKQLDSGYAWPVRDDADFIRSLEDIAKETGEISEKNPELIALFEDIIGGSYKIIKDRGLVYRPRKSKGKSNFSMGESSSCVRALLNIGFYLRCKAKPGDILIIDEPELNLHPRNQRNLARLLARLANVGVKIFITTHSDYIIKEINTLIMLSNKNVATKKVQADYHYDDQELLNSTQVKLYMTESRLGIVTGANRKSKINTLTQANISSEFGIEATTFDTTINEMNEIQASILYSD